MERSRFAVWPGRGVLHITIKYAHSSHRGAAGMPMPILRENFSGARIREVVDDHHGDISCHSRGQVSGVSIERPLHFVALAGQNSDVVANLALCSHRQGHLRAIEAM